jgi:hypothetical protein
MLLCTLAVRVSTPTLSSLVPSTHAGGRERGSILEQHAVRVACDEPMCEIIGGVYRRPAPWHVSSSQRVGSSVFG